MECHQIIEAIQATIQILGKIVEIFQGFLENLGKHSPSSVDMAQGLLNMYEQPSGYQEGECYGPQLAQDPVPIINNNPIFSARDGG